MTDPRIAPQLRELQLQTRHFVTKQLQPVEREIEKNGQVPSELVERMKELGFFGLTVPTEYGGSGLGALGMCLVVMELGHGHSAIRALISVNNSIGSRAIVTDGSKEQRDRYLPRMASGEVLACFALTEPAAGSDAAGIKTRAEPKDGGFVLNGSKHFVTHSPEADLFVTLAVTDPEKASRGGLTAFLIDKGTKGLRIGRMHETMGSRATDQAEVIFEDCFVPRSAVLGEVGFGFRTFMKTLDYGRLAISATAVGNAQRLLTISRDYARQRNAFGKPISEFQTIRHMLADMATELYAAEAMLIDTAWQHEQGVEVRQKCAMVKLFCSEMAGRVADTAVHIHGGMGYMADLPVERLFREIRAFRIVEGTSEIQREIISKHVLQ